MGCPRGVRSHAAPEGDRHHLTEIFFFPPSSPAVPPSFRSLPMVLETKW